MPTETELCTAAIPQLRMPGFMIWPIILDINLKGAVTWAFEFENQPWFNGYRDLATNGIDKPVLNIFRMFGKMSGDRVEVSGDLAYDFEAVRDSSVSGEKRDINALAAVNDSMATVMLWNYHDLNVVTPAQSVALTIQGIPSGKVEITQYRVDENHSNSYEKWKEMGSPQDVNAEQYAELEQAGKLDMAEKPKTVKVKAGSYSGIIELPGQAVSLLILKWK